MRQVLIVHTNNLSLIHILPEVQEIEISQDVLQELHLQSGGTLTISVTDIDTGEIVRGAIVERSDSTEVEYASWNEGIAQLHLPYGSYEIKVSADYYYASETIEVEITPDNDSVELNVELAAVRTLEGAVSYTHLAVFHITIK